MSLTKRNRLIGVCQVALLAAIGSARSDDSGVAFFEKKIRPVLVQHCYECHSEHSGEIGGGLRLDAVEGVLQGGDSGPAVVAGAPDDSPLIQAVRHESLEMPPDGLLPDHVIQDFEHWVSIGAPLPEPSSSLNPVVHGARADQQFWSFQPIASSPSPPLEDEAWPRSDIDRFVLARLEQDELAPVADADRLTLLRRIYFDLVGLPPTPEEIASFLSDDDPRAVRRVVDELLASPRFGERWGRHWLDVARFAESSGGGRSQLFHRAWRYRDYVVDAFNSDKPFDRFVKEQIAGDLLPTDSLSEARASLTATGFLLLGPTNYELQDKELLRMEVVDEQIDAMGRAFLGMTIGCARCHNHKFDPIPTTDYYALAGIFRSTHSLVPGNVSGWLERPLPTTAELERKYAEFEQAQQAIAEQITALQGKLGVLDPEPGVLSVASLTGVVVDDVDAEIVGNWLRSSSVKNYVGDGYLHDGDEGKGDKSVAFTAHLPTNGQYEVRLAYAPASNRAKQTEVLISHADGEVTQYVDQTQSPSEAGVFLSLGQFRFLANSPAKVVVSNQGSIGHVIADCVQFLPVDVGDPADDPSLAASDAGPSAEELAMLEATRGELAKLRIQLASLNKQAPPKRTTVMSVEDHEESGDYHVCIRGDAHNLGAAAPRGFLTAANVHGSPQVDERASGRLELAEWLTSPRNPLPARVICNRVWRHLLGVGIVRTTDNFGATGEAPSHPELLDHLAQEFIDDGWSIKNLVRRIMTSRTYQLSTQFDAAAYYLDPQNRLLWRSNRRRLDAEALRDAILFVSGDLDLAAGGKTFSDDLKLEYGFEHGTLRRSIYVPVFRNTLLDVMEAFDFPNPNTVQGNRTTSTLPTQALFLLNSPFIVDASRKAALRLLESDRIGNDERLETAFLQTLGRPPTSAESDLLLEFVRGRSPDEEQQFVWSQVYHALFSSVDFRYLQ